MVHSTRSNNQITMSKAILKGLASDGGLFIFDEIKKIDINSLYGKKYQEIAIEVFKKYFDEFEDDEINWAVNNAYSKENFGDYPVTLKEFDSYAYLELFNGPTAAFKDMALTILPRLMYLSKKKNGIKDNTHIFVATSGDTGSATLLGFYGTEGIDVTVLYPNKLVSNLQEKQMLYYSNNKSRAYALKGNFDDCQRLVKAISLDNKMVSSANSINIGRLIPQIVYYFYGYIKLVENGIVKNGETINVCVPTGNFGNILAGYIAKQMGCPIDKLICAANENNILYDFINTGIYDSNRKFIKTYAPSMDILVSSNVERLLYFFYKDASIIKEMFEKFKETGIIKVDKNLFKDFKSYYATNDEILEEINHEYNAHNYLIDPHTAVAYNAYKKSVPDGNEKYTLILSTASCYKFEDAIYDAKVEFSMDNAIPNIKKVMNKEIDKEIKDNVVDEKDVWEMVRCLK